MKEARACFQRAAPAARRGGHPHGRLRRTGCHPEGRSRRLLQAQVFPVLTPLAFDPGRPFPHISNLSLNLAVADPQTERRGALRPRQYRLPARWSRAGALGRVRAGNDVTTSPEHSSPGSSSSIAANLDDSLPGHARSSRRIPSASPATPRFAIQELEADDLLETIEEGVRQRRFGRVVRLTVDSGMPERRPRHPDREPRSRPQSDVYPMEPPLGMSGLDLLRPRPARPEVSPFVPAPAARASTTTPRRHLRRHPPAGHPPAPPLRLVRRRWWTFSQRAARDPDVLAIKQTLYRVGRNSPVVDALLEAADNGKQVAVLRRAQGALRRGEQHRAGPALGARGRARRLRARRAEDALQDRAGGAPRGRAHPPLRAPGHGQLQRVTAQLYTDLGLLTCDERSGADASDLFNYLTGYSDERDYRKFLVAPINLRRGIEER